MIFPLFVIHVFLDVNTVNYCWSWKSSYILGVLYGRSLTQKKKVLSYVKRI